MLFGEKSNSNSIKCVIKLVAIVNDSYYVETNCSLNFDLPDEAVLYVLGAIENNNLLCVLGVIEEK